MKNYILLSLILLTVAGCQESQQARSVAVVINADNFETIAGMQWTLKQMVVNGQRFKLTDPKPFIQFNAEERKVTGFASINQFFGSVKIDQQGNVQWPGPFGSTRMAGPSPQMQQEDTFLKALPRTQRLTKSGTDLQAVTTDGKTELIFFNQDE